MNNLSMWIKYLKTINNTKALRTAAFFTIIGIVFILMHFKEHKVYSEAGLTEIKAVITHRNQIKLKRYRGPDAFEYVIELQGYNNSFIINDAQFDYFRKNVFETFVAIGNPVFVSISRSDVSDLNTGNDIRIYGLSGYKEVYLNYKKAIEMDNSKAPFYMGLLMIAIGILLFYYHKDKLITE